MSDIVKVCKKHGPLTVDNCKLKSDGWLRCSICITENNKKYYESIKNTDQYKQISAYRSKLQYDQLTNPKTDEEKLKREKYLKRHRLKSNNYRKTTGLDKYRDYQKADQKRQSDNLTDYYVKKKLRQIPEFRSLKTIPKELIEFKRALLMLKRELRKQNGKNSS